MILVRAIGISKQILYSTNSSKNWCNLITWLNRIRNLRRMINFSKTRDKLQMKNLNNITPIQRYDTSKERTLHTSYRHYLS